MSDGEDFSKAPVTIAELRADRERNAGKWTPRDALVRILRELDEGTLKIDVISIIHAEISDDTGTKVGFCNASPNLPAVLGVIEMGKNLMAS